MTTCRACPSPLAPDTYPGKDDVASYLQAYAAKFKLPVRLNTNVTSLTRSDGGYVAKAGGEALEARQVVVATGPFQVPFIPPIADALDPGVHQIHSAHYRRPETLPAGKVLVVGAANSGCQIAQELSATHHVELSVGQRIPAIPQRPLGRDIWAWATALRLDKVTADSRLGQRLAGRDQVIGPGPRQLARRHGIRIRPRAAGAAGRTVTFADGSAADFDAVVWATGYTADHTWIDIPEARRAGTHPAPTGRDALAWPVHARPDVAAHPGLRPARLGRPGRGVPGRADRAPVNRCQWPWRPTALTIAAAAGAAFLPAAARRHRP